MTRFFPSWNHQDEVNAATSQGVVEIVDAKEKNLKKQTLRIGIERNNKFFDQMDTGVARMLNSGRLLNLL